MEKLAFRIVLVPWEKYPMDLNSLIEEHRKRLAACGLCKINLEALKLERSQDEPFPEIEELILQVNASWSNSICIEKTKCYKKLCSKWKALFYPNPSPLLALFESNSFLNFNQAVHQFVVYSSISFGVLPYNGKFYEYSNLTLQGHVDFLHDLREVSIFYNDWEIKFPYGNIRNIFVNIDTSPCEIFFDLSNPPIVSLLENKFSTTSGHYTVRYMTADIKFKVGKREWQEIDTGTLGKSNVLRLSLNNSKIADEVIGRIHFKCSGKPIHYGYIVTEKRTVPSFPEFEWNHFGCTYLMTAIFQRSFLMAAQTLNIFTSFVELMELNLQNEECMEKALTVTLAAIDSGKIVNYWLAVEQQFNFYLKNKTVLEFSKCVTPEKCVYVRRITLTPTRQLLWPPEIMIGNRVLRRFDSEYAVRVLFRDDNHSRLSFHAYHAEDSIFEKAILKPMLSGISIGNRHYEFLAWSNSQLRDHGVWMYAKDLQGNNVKSIRAWMGDFSHIHSVSKFMARMGQCFSQTEDTVSVPFDSVFVQTEDDIERGYDPANKKPYCFSDGIGRISPCLAKKVHDALGHDKLCCAFQIRYGGYKGMLVVDPNLEDIAIVFRKSMKKFDSPGSIKLEIAKTSAPAPLQLNRPFITILNDLGVRHRTFLKMQEDMLRNITDMLFDEEQAREFLSKNTPMDIIKFKDLSEAGIYLTTETFFKSLLLACHHHYINKLKTKASVSIDANKGRNMFGVLDETGLLEEGQVFVQYTRDISFGETTRDTVILKGIVLVTKNPCMFPGDVRKFTAVDIPQLHHIVDCIAFPQKGSRPHPNEMAGSDLDGDEYAVLWDENLIFHSDNHPPELFRNVSGKILPEKKKIEIEDMISFLMDYIKHDHVGSIASAHLAQADQTSVFCEKAISIARKFGLAVDYAKTGDSQKLYSYERPKKFPDFMERTYQESYKSTKALGKMYRVTKDYEAENQEASFSYRNIQVDKDLVFPGMESYLPSAAESRNKYNTILRTILRSYGIEHEADVFSGAFSNLHYPFKHRKDKQEVEKVAVLCIKSLLKSTREEFFQEFSEFGKVSEMKDNMLKKASAWYNVTYMDKNTKFLSFPWIVSELLVVIKLSKSTKPLSLFSPIISKMDEQICLIEKKLPLFYETNEWNKYNYLCDPFIVKRALGVLLLWAQDERIISEPGVVKLEGFMFRKTFIKLFFYVAEISKYIVKKEETVKKEKLYSSASLCLAFLRFCLKLRFYNEQEVLNVIPFRVYKYTALSKRAVVAYHRFATLGIFQNIYLDTNKNEDMVEMRPIYIESKIFERTPIKLVLLQRAQETLIAYSGVNELKMREIMQTKKILVSATGNEQSLKTLKSILRKKHDFLRHLFKTKKMPNVNMC